MGGGGCVVWWLCSSCLVCELYVVVVQMPSVVVVQDREGDVCG